MASSLWTLQFQTLSFQPSSIWASKHRDWSRRGFRRNDSRNMHLNWNMNRQLTDSKFLARATEGSVSSDSDNNVLQGDDVAINADNAAVDSNGPYGKLQHTILSSSPIVFLMNRSNGSNIAIGLCIATAFLVIVSRIYVVRNSRKSHPGSVADLVRRGQLRSDRRGISRPLKYDDPFNNPLVKVGKSKSTVEMCGKVYRLAPVTLTGEQQAVHQRRRSRAYQWKRPTVFLKEGDSIPADVDPDTIRWIPANHPFATTASDIDEDLAQNNVYQKHGVPFRIQAEHEALQRKLESLQSEQKLNKLAIDPSYAKDFEKPYKSKPRADSEAEQSPLNNQPGDCKSPIPISEGVPNSFGVKTSTEGTQTS